MSRSEGRLLSVERARIQANENAQAAIDLVLVALSDPKGGWPTDGTPQTIRFNDIDIEVAASAESGKIDLNTGDAALIHGVLMVAGAGSGDADKMTDAILDRRKPIVSDDANSNANGNNLNAAHWSPFRSLAELFQIPGMTRDVFDRLAPNITLYSGSSSVDIGLASSDVLLAIPGNTRADAEAALRERSFPGQSDRTTADLSRVIGQAFSVSAKLRTQDGIIVRKTEIVRLVANPTQPVWILAVK
jgi:general secretion pathway protein K